MLAKYETGVLSDLPGIANPLREHDEVAAKPLCGPARRSRGQSPSTYPVKLAGRWPTPTAQVSSANYLGRSGEGVDQEPALVCVTGEACVNGHARTGVSAGVDKRVAFLRDF